jgi:hypothetical protein
MIAAAATSAINALVIGVNSAVFSTGWQFAAVGLFVALIYGFIGWLHFFMERHVFQLWFTPGFCPGPAAKPLSRLTCCIGIYSAGVWLVMLTSLYAVIQRISDGYAVFG